mmetsp:Transcript_8471/g.9564  ORF Transcript_8471/g.9564 Transcript_8471/m.9564 type:complete len:235 (-) Transcript_8471:81-785(-)
MVVLLLFVMGYSEHLFDRKILDENQHILLRAQFSELFLVQHFSLSLLLLKQLNLLQFLSSISNLLLGLIHLFRFVLRCLLSLCFCCFRLLSFLLSSRFLCFLKRRCFTGLKISLLGFWLCLLSFLIVLLLSNSLFLGLYFSTFGLSLRFGFFILFNLFFRFLSAVSSFLSWEVLFILTGFCRCLLFSWFYIDPFFICLEFALISIIGWRIFFWQINYHYFVAVLLMVTAGTLGF